MLPMQQGDLRKLSILNLGGMDRFRPNTSIKKGISLFIDWFKDFYNY